MVSAALVEAAVAAGLAASGAFVGSAAFAGSGAFVAAGAGAGDEQLVANNVAATIRDTSEDKMVARIDMACLPS